MPDNAADRKDIRRREKQARIDTAQRASVILNVMSTTSGRAWLWDILTTCHVFTTTFTGDALTSAFGEGERNVGQRLLNDITSNCPDEFIQAMREAYVRASTDERRSSPQHNGGDSGSGGSAEDGDDGDEVNRYINDHDARDEVRY